MKGAATYKNNLKKNDGTSIRFLEVTTTLMLFIEFHAEKSVSRCHQGLSDVRKHFKRLTHVSFAKAIKNNRSMATFLVDNDEGTNSLKEKTIRAEVLYINFMVHHNLSFFRQNTFLRYTLRCSLILRLQGTLTMVELKQPLY